MKTSSVVALISMHLFPVLTYATPVGFFPGESWANWHLEPVQQGEMVLHVSYQGESCLPVAGRDSFILLEWYDSIESEWVEMTIQGEEESEVSQPIAFSSPSFHKTYEWLMEEDIVNYSENSILTLLLRCTITDPCTGRDIILEDSILYIVGAPATGDFRFWVSDGVISGWDASGSVDNVLYLDNDLIDIQAIFESRVVGQEVQAAEINLVPTQGPWLVIPVALSPMTGPFFGGSIEGSLQDEITYEIQGQATEPSSVVQQWPSPETAGTLVILDLHATEVTSQTYLEIEWKL